MKRKRGVDKDDVDWKEEELRERLPERKRRKKEEVEEEEEEEENDVLPSEDDFMAGEESDAGSFIAGGSEEDDEEDEEKLCNDPEAGIIEELTLENFMCHKKLRVKFKSHINVITGRNGSGKSAVVIGIQAVLGGKKPRQVKKITDLIRSGADGCDIRIVLRNRGPDGYRKDIFGKRIIIERSVSGRSNSSSYKIMSEHSEVIYRAKKDLDQILKHFNIHITNPCVMMTQDDAKTFLAESQGKKKYELFMQATQLQAILENYHRVVKSKELMEATLKTKTSQLETIKETLELMKDDIEITERIQQSAERIKFIRCRLMWIMVVQVEINIKKIEDRVEEEEVGLVEVRNQLEEVQGRLLVARKEDDENGKKLETQVQKKRVFQDTIFGKKEEKAEQQRHVTRLESNIEDLNTRIVNQQKYIDKRKRKMEEIRNRVSESNVEEVANLEESIQKQKIRIQEITRDEIKTKEESREFDSKSTLLEDERDEAHNKLKDLVRKIQRYDNEIRSLDRQKKDRMSYFGNDIMNVLREIGKARWDKIPIGPVFLYLNVVDQRWAGAVEKQLFLNRNSFIVHSAKDCQNLKRICSRIYQNQRRPDIVIFPFDNEVQRIPNHKQVPQRLNILDGMIKVDLSLVKESNFPHAPEKLVQATLRNYLMDYRQTEITILVEDRKQLEEIFFKQRPANALRGLSMNGTVVEWKNNKEFTQASNVDPKGRFFGDESDINAQIKELKSLIIEEKKLEPGYKKDVRQKSVLKDNNVRKIAELDEKAFTLNRRKKNVEKQIKKMKAKLQEIKDSDVGDEGDKEEELREQQEQIEKSEHQIAKIRIQITEIQKELEDSRPESKRLEVEIKKTEREKAKVEEIIQEMTREARIKEKKIRRIQIEEREILENESRKKRIIFALGEKKKELEMDKRKTEGDAVDEFPIRPEGVEGEVDKVEEYNEDLRKCERDLNREQSKLGGKTIEQIKEEYNAELKRYTDTKEYLGVGDINLKIIGRGLSDRMEKWRKIRFSYCKVAKLAFNRSLSQKGHSGQILFDHKDQLLTTEIQLNGTSNDGRKVRDTKSLSGGEKSFSTLAFLTSLWEVAESPFRCLDEVDIFMDNVYRKKALDLLVDVAMNRKHRNSQLLIVTPQSTRGITDAKTKKDKKRREKHIHVIKMKDPERNGMVQTSMEDYMED